MKKANQTKQGYAILELLFYISFFTVLSLVVINAMIAMTGSFRETSVQAEFVQSGNIMERISREIRAANDINTIGAGRLVLNTKDDTGADKTVEFLLSGGNAQIIENSVQTGNLNAPGITVVDLSFAQITTIEGKAVKIAITIQSSSDKFNRLVDFYDTVALRGSY